jgi:deoxyribose-phosphate aldolase
MNRPTLAELGKMFDHSLLQPKLTDADLEAGCKLAVEYGAATVCIKPYAVARAASLLFRTGVDVCTVVGFPHGSNTPDVKVFETNRVIDDGAREVDMVVNIGKVLSNDWGYVAADIAAVTGACHARGAIVKVIFENSMLTDGHKIKLSEICGDLRCDYVKTSTGYGDGGATTEDLKLMRKHAPSYVRIKAAGGVRTFERLMEVRELGVTRVGATATADILNDAKKKLGS